MSEGGSGLDNINGGLANVVLFQNDAVNERDGYMGVINCDMALIIESDGDIAANDYETIKSVRVRNVLIK